MYIDGWMSGKGYIRKRRIEEDELINTGITVHDVMT